MALHMLQLETYIVGATYSIVNCSMLIHLSQISLTISVTTSISHLPFPIPPQLCPFPPPISNEERMSRKLISVLNSIVE
jgi:hypothetical protein